jgi:hypothetical protein
MRKITQDAVRAFRNHEDRKFGNTEIVAFTNKTVMYLHGNAIATISRPGGVLRITDGGWPTKTTKERLNGLPGVNIYQEKWQWFLNGKAWDGSLKKVN